MKAGHKSKRRSGQAGAGQVWARPSMVRRLHNFCGKLIFVKYLGHIIKMSWRPLWARESKIAKKKMSTSRLPRFALPLQVAAICYRFRGPSVEFLLVNTNGGGKWTFPKGATADHLSHSEAAAREAWEEAGARGTIESKHFHLYVYSKGVFWRSPGVQEFVVKAFLMEVERMANSHEPKRHPTWFSPEAARKALAKGREVKYAREMQTVIDRAMDHLSLLRPALAQ